MTTQTGKIFKDIQQGQTDLETRLEKLETKEYNKLVWFAASGYLLSGVAITVGAPYTTPDVTASMGIPAYVQGVFGSIWANGAATLYLAPSGVTPTGYMQNIYTNNTPGMFMIKLGADGKFTILSTASVNISATVFAYWL